MFTMCICDLVKDFKVIGARIRKVPTEHETRVFCRRFWENLEGFLETSQSDLGDKVSGLELAVEHFSNHREYLSDCEDVNELFNVVFMTCARVILSLDWQNLSDEDYAKESFIAALKRCEPKLIHYSHIQIEVLNQLVQAQWTEPLLAQIMDCGEDGIDKEEVSKYLFEQHPDILRLRLSLLMENGCDEFALNLATWLTKMLVFSQDIDVLQKYMILLIRQGQRDQFHKKCSKVQCHTAVEIIKCVREKPGFGEVALIMAQTFLGQDLFKPTYYCCTKTLLTMWMELQSKKDGDRHHFTDSLQKMTRLCKDSVQLTYFAETLHSLFDDEYLSICVSLLVKAFKADAVMFASHKRGVKDINLVSMTASLIHVCNLLSGMLRKHSSLISQLSMLTAFSLDPSQELYSFVELLYSVINAEKRQELENKLARESRSRLDDNENESENETGQKEAMNDSSETIIEGETENITENVTNEDVTQNDSEMTTAVVAEVDKTLSGCDEQIVDDTSTPAEEKQESESGEESHAVVEIDPVVESIGANKTISGTDVECPSIPESGDKCVDEDGKESQLESSGQVALPLTENVEQNSGRTENTENNINTDPKSTLEGNDACENTEIDECDLSIELHEEKKDSVSLPENECKNNGEVEKTIDRESGVEKTHDEKTEKSMTPDEVSEEQDRIAASKIASFSDSYENFLRTKTFTPSIDSNVDSPMSNGTSDQNADTTVVKASTVAAVVPVVLDGSEPVVLDGSEPIVLDGSDAPSSDHDRDDSRSNEVKDGQEEGNANMEVSDCSTEVNSIHDPESPDKVIMTRSLLRKRRSERPTSPGDKRTKYSDSECSDSEVEAEPESNKYGIEIPGVDSAVVNELISTLEYLRDKDLDPNLEWDTLKGVCEKRILTRAQTMMTIDEENEEETFVEIPTEDETTEKEMETALRMSETVSVADMLGRKGEAQLKPEMTTVVEVPPNPSELPVLSSADLQEHLGAEASAMISAQARLDHITETLATRTGAVVTTAPVPKGPRLPAQVNVRPGALPVGSLALVRPQASTTPVMKSPESPAMSVTLRTPAPRILGQRFRAVTPPVVQPAHSPISRLPPKAISGKQAKVSSTVNELLSQRQLDAQTDVMAEGSPTYVIVKSPVNLDNQQCQLTKVNGQVYKIWQSKNKSKYNLTAGQRIIGIKPLFVKPGSEDQPSPSASEQMDNQTIEQVLRSLMDKNKQSQTTVRELIASRDQKKMSTGSLMAVSLGETIALPGGSQFVTASSSDALTSGTTTYIFNSVKLARGQTVVTGDHSTQIITSLANNGQLLESKPNVQKLSSTDSCSDPTSPLARMGPFSVFPKQEVMETTAQCNQVNSFVVSSLNQHSSQLQPGLISKQSQQSERTSVSSIHDQQQVHRQQLSTAVVQQPSGVVIMSPSSSTGQTQSLDSLSHPERTNSTTSGGESQLVENIAQQERIRLQIQELLGMAVETDSDQGSVSSQQLSAVIQTPSPGVTVQSAGVTGQTRVVTQSTIGHRPVQSTSVQGTVQSMSTIVPGTVRSAVQVPASSVVQMSVRSQGLQVPLRSPGAQTPVRSQAVQKTVRSPTVQIPLRSPGVQVPVQSPRAQVPVQHAVIKRPYKITNTRPTHESTNDKLQTNLQHLAEAEKIRQQCLMQNRMSEQYQACKSAFQQGKQRRMQKVVVGAVPRDNPVNRQVGRTQLLQQNVARPHSSVQQVHPHVSRTPTQMVTKAASQVAVTQTGSNVLVTQTVRNLPVTQAVRNVPVTQAIINSTVTQAFSNLPVTQAISNLPVTPAISNSTAIQPVRNLPVGSDSAVAQTVSNLAATQTVSSLAVSPAASTVSSLSQHGTVLLNPHSSSNNGPLTTTVLQRIKTLSSYNKSPPSKPHLQAPPKPARSYRRPKATTTVQQVVSAQPAKPLSTESQNLKNQLIATWQSPPRSEEARKKEREPVLASLAKRLNDTISQHQPGQTSNTVTAVLNNSRTPKTVRTITSGRSPPANVPQVTSAGYFVPTNVVKAYPGAKIQVLASAVVAQTSPPAQVNQGQGLIVQRTQNQCNS